MVCRIPPRPHHTLAIPIATAKSRVTRHTQPHKTGIRTVNSQKSHNPQCQACLPVHRDLTVSYAHNRMRDDVHIKVPNSGLDCTARQAEVTVPSSHELQLPVHLALARTSKAGWLVCIVTPKLHIVQNFKATMNLNRHTSRTGATVRFPMSHCKCSQNSCSEDRHARPHRQLK